MALLQRSGGGRARAIVGENAAVLLLKGADGIKDFPDRLFRASRGGGPFPRCRERRLPVVQQTRGEHRVLGGVVIIKRADGDAALFRNGAHRHGGIALLGHETARRGEDILFQIVNDLRHNARLPPVFMSVFI